MSAFVQTIVSHQLMAVLGKTLDELEGKVAKGTKAISLIKVHISPPRHRSPCGGRRLRLMV